jgi:hypothetical protein
MTKKAFIAAQSKDYNNAKKQWLELTKILEVNYSVKNKGVHEMLLNIPKENIADIEIMLSGRICTNTYRVQLWYLKLPEEYKHMQSMELNTLSGVIDHIGTLLMIVKQLAKQVK